MSCTALWWSLQTRRVQLCIGEVCDAVVLVATVAFKRPTAQPFLDRWTCRSAIKEASSSTYSVLKRLFGTDFLVSADPSRSFRRLTLLARILPLPFSSPAASPVVTRSALYTQAANAPAFVPKSVTATGSTNDSGAPSPKLYVDVLAIQGDRASPRRSLGRLRRFRLPRRRSFQEARSPTRRRSLARLRPKPFLSFPW